MQTSIPKELLKEFLSIVATGNEAKARAFMIDHLKEFPEDIQSDIIAASFEEALDESNEEDRLVLAARKKLLDEMNALGKERSELEKQIKLEEIRSDIKKSS